MADYTLKELANFSWMESLIPALPALVATVPDGAPNEEIRNATSGRPSRWYPVDGGHRVVVLYESPFPHDGDCWKVEVGAWDHEHCNRCNATIPAMTLCWATRTDPYVLLCEHCHAAIAEAVK